MLDAQKSATYPFAMWLQHLFSFVGTVVGKTGGHDTYSQAGGPTSLTRRCQLSSWAWRICRILGVAGDMLPILGRMRPGSLVWDLGFRAELLPFFPEFGYA